MKIDHIGIAVESLEEGVKLYKDGLNLTELEIEVVEEQQVRVLKLDVDGVHIELLEPLKPGEGPIGQFIAKQGKGGFHHIAYQVPNILKTVENLKSLGYKTLGDEPRIGAGGMLIIFLHPKDTGNVLTEICQQRD